MNLAQNAANDSEPVARIRNGNGEGSTAAFGPAFKASHPQSDTPGGCVTDCPPAPVVRRPIRGGPLPHSSARLVRGLSRVCCCLVRRCGRCKGPPHRTVVVACPRPCVPMRSACGRRSGSESSGSQSRKVEAVALCDSADPKQRRTRVSVRYLGARPWLQDARCGDLHNVFRDSAHRIEYMASDSSVITEHSVIEQVDHGIDVFALVGVGVTSAGPTVTP